MTLPWFRLYHRVIDDEKIRLLAFEDRWHFIALCCLKADGLLDKERDALWQRKVAVKMGVQLRELEEIGRRLSEVGLVDSDMNPVAWNELQYKSDNSTARVKEFRKRQQKQGRNNVKRFGNVSVTAQDTDTDTELSPKGDCASGDALTPQEVVDDWNAMAGRYGLPQVRKLTTSRKRRLQARLRQYPELEDWQRAFSEIAKNKWMHGDNPKGWRADFDFLLQDKSFTKLTEGAYGQA